MNAFEQRLQVLEHELQRSRRVNQIFILAAALIVCIAGAQGDTPEQSKSQKPVASTDASPRDVGRLHGTDRFGCIEANRFVLVDQLGRSRAKMLVTDNGPEISMFDEEGHKRLELSQTGSASGLRMFDSNESAVVSLQLPTQTDSAYLEFGSAQGRSLITSDGFSVHDASQVRLNLSLLNGNFPVLAMSQRGQDGPPSIELTCSDEARMLKIHDEDGNPLFSVAADHGGGTTLEMRHPRQQRSLQISARPQEPGPVVAFFAPARDDGSGGLLPRLQIGFGNDCQPEIRLTDSDGRIRFVAPSD
jgi:hypothetical protein